MRRRLIVLSRRCRIRCTSIPSSSRYRAERKKNTRAAFRFAASGAPYHVPRKLPFAHTTNMASASRAAHPVSSRTSSSTKSTISKAFSTPTQQLSCMTKKVKKKSDTRFAFFGTPELATVFLDDLEREGLVPSLVVTTPARPKGRGMALTSPPVKMWAAARNILVLQPERLDTEFVSKLTTRSWQLFIVIYYGKILPREIFSIPKHGTINIHFSLLPRWKGTSPIRAAILNDDRKMGTSLVLMDEQIDHGPLIAQKAFHIENWPPSARELEVFATHESAKLLNAVIEPWVSGEIEAREQNHDLETLCPTLEKADVLLDLSGDPHTNLLKIRAFDSTIGTHAFFERSGKRIRVQILDAHVENGALVIDKVKPEGKREMAYAEFLRSGAKPN